VPLTLSYIDSTRRKYWEDHWYITKAQYIRRRDLKLNRSSSIKKNVKIFFLFDFYYYICLTIKNIRKWNTTE
jgi:hypothetical protein